MTDLPPSLTTPETLDPENWDEARALGHRMIDDMIDYLSSVRERPAWRSVPDDVKSVLDESLPRGETPLAEVYDTFRENILPYPTGNQHPGFFGWVMGNGTPTAMFADMLASGMNPHLAGYDQSASLIEKQVIKWWGEILGFPTEASGLLVSGGTMANLNGVAVARSAKVDYDLRQHGLSGVDAPKLTLYGSSETHSWILKACDLMGLGRDAWRVVPVDDQYQVNVDAMANLIQSDIEKGFTPFCIIGSVGTVNTGAVDDIAALRKLADQHDLWLHIDGAFGSLAALAPEYKDKVAAQSTADSIAFDLHKWGYLPYDVGCTIVRKAQDQLDTFTQNPSYLQAQTRGLSVDGTYFSDRGLQLSRGFRALKVWMQMKETGTDKLGRLIQQNIDQCAYLGSLIEAHPELELMAPVTMNIVCYRYRPENAGANDLNALNQELLLRIQESGTAVPSQTILDGQFAIRVANTNHRATKETFDQLVKNSVRFARDIIAQH